MYPGSRPGRSSASRRRETAGRFARNKPPKPKTPSRSRYTRRFDVTRRIPEPRAGRETMPPPRKTTRTFPLRHARESRVGRRTATRPSSLSRPRTRARRARCLFRLRPSRKPSKRLSARRKKDSPFRLARRKRNFSVAPLPRPHRRGEAAEEWNNSEADAERPQHTSRAKN